MNFVLDFCIVLWYNEPVMREHDVRLISRWMVKHPHAPVAQLDRAFACGAKGRRFESCRVYHI